MKTTIISTISLLIGITTPFLATGQEAGATVPTPQAQQADNVQAEMAKLEQEFRSVANKLRDIEEKAMAKKEVAASKDKFDNLVQEAVVEKSPELEEAVEKRAEYLEVIEKAQQGKPVPDDVDINEVYSQYNSLHQKVMPVEQQVMQEKKVQEAFNAYRQRLLAQMNEIDENVMTYVRRQEEIRSKYQELVAQQQG